MRRSDPELTQEITEEDLRALRVLPARRPIRCTTLRRPEGGSNPLGDANGNKYSMSVLRQRVATRPLRKLSSMAHAIARQLGAHDRFGNGAFVTPFGFQPE